MKKNDILAIWKQKLQIIKYTKCQFQIDQIRKYFLDHIVYLPPAWQGAYNHKTNTAPRIPIRESKNIGFGGWSLIGPSKNYWDGWLPNGYLPHWGTNLVQDYKDAVIKTWICNGPMLEMISGIENSGLKLSRARITITKPNIPLMWHKDNNDDDEMVIRIQFPLIANPNTWFMSETEKWHIPSDGNVYLVNTEYMHKVENNGDTLRFNIIADVDIDSLPDDDCYEIFVGQNL